MALKNCETFVKQTTATWNHIGYSSQLSKAEENCKIWDSSRLTYQAERPLLMFRIRTFLGKEPSFIIRVFTCRRQTQTTLISDFHREKAFLHCIEIRGIGEEVK